MKLVLGTVALAVVAMVPAEAAAQYVVAPDREAERVPVPVEITPSVGYAFENGVSVPGGALDLAGAPVFGATVDIGDWFGGRFEASYVLQNTNLRFDSDFGGSQSLYDITLHHFQAGGEFDILRGPVRPFVGITLGLAYLAPHAFVPDEVWFESSLEGGAKFRVTRNLAIRAQAVLTTLFMDSSSNIFCSSGCFTPWYGNIGTVQLALSAGPTVVF